MTDSMSYLQVSDEILSVVWGGRVADPELIVAEMARLRAMAERIEDPVWRQRALRQVELLPSKVAGPREDGSRQYREAEALVARAYELTGPLPERLAELDRIAALVGRVAGEAPADEEPAIRVMASSLSRLAQSWHRQAGRGVNV